MTTTNSVLKTFTNRKIFNKYADKVKKTFFTKEQYVILKSIRRLFESDPDLDNVTTEEVFYVVQSERPEKLKKADVDNYKTILDNIEKAEVCLPSLLVDHCYTEAIKDLTTKMAGAPPKQLDKLYAELETLWNERKFYDNAQNVSHVVDFDMERILNRTERKGGLTWPKPFEDFNVMVGPLIQSDFIILGASVNCGKTVVACNLMVDFATQIEPDETILFYNGEGSTDKLYMALLRVALKKPEKWIRDNPKEATEMYDKKLGGKNKILICEGRDLDLMEVYKDLMTYKCRFVVFDQLDHLKFGKHRSGMESKDSMKLVYDTTRKLCIDFCPMMAISQLAQAKTEYEVQLKDDNGRWTGEKDRKYLQNIPYTCFRGDTGDKAASADIVMTMNFCNGIDKYKRNIYLAKNKINGVFDQTAHNVRLDQETLLLGKV